MKVKVSAGATCYLAILNTAGHLHPRAVLDAKLPPVSNDDEYQVHVLNHQVCIRQYSISTSTVRC